MRVNRSAHSGYLEHKVLPKLQRQRGKYEDLPHEPGRIRDHVPLDTGISCEGGCKQGLHVVFSDYLALNDSVEVPDVRNDFTQSSVTIDHGESD